MTTKNRRNSLFISTLMVLLLFLLSGCGSGNSAQDPPEDDNPNLDVEIPKDAEEAVVGQLYTVEEETEYEAVEHDPIILPPDSSFDYSGKTEVALVKPMAFNLMSQSDYVAPKGKIFQAFELNLSGVTGYDAVARVGDSTYPLSAEDLDRTKNFVVLTDPDEEVLLDFESVLPGPTQTLNLSTGERVTTEIAPDLYSGKTVEMPEKSFEVTTNTDVGDVVWFGEIREVKRVTFDEEKRWADPENGELSWLAVAIEPNDFRDPGDGVKTLHYESTTITIEDANGQTYESDSTSGSVNTGRTFWFKVPSGGTGYKATLTTIGGVTKVGMDAIEIKPSVTLDINVVDE